jgi:dTDP-4-dehydrorhamnose reductase
MIVLLGGSGYVGQAFRRALLQRQQDFVNLSRSTVDYTKYDVLIRSLERTSPTFLINAAGYTGKPNVDACETARADTLNGNTLFPCAVSRACMTLDIPWAHVSSGCIYSGAKIEHGDGVRVEPDLTLPHLRQILAQRSTAVRGFVEEDPPNFSFRSPPCSFYSGTKALAEEALAADHRLYMWRLRIPFDHRDNSRNYLSKLLRYPRIYENFNSLSQLDDFVNACLSLYETKAAYGIYNVTNPGYVSTRRVVELIQMILTPDRTFEYWSNDQEFYNMAAKTPRSNCILDVSKLLATGITMRPVEEALIESLQKWEWECHSRMT